ncbi:MULTISPECIES: hypothetical protein [Pseudomonas]|uniref:Uncharacterized protein n=1 Tax=Pseudomonas putida S13.1.2 TaxID=1384061 RepID=A0AAU8RYH4_PSEPU|nr:MULTISPECIES: hypothetical protein [Pseudomonas]AJQ48247.1 hypothetical protein N805_13900 [Pseudomonas putida S13.1.2]
MHKDSDDFGKVSHNRLAPKEEAVADCDGKRVDGSFKQEEKFPASEFQLSIEDKWQDKSHDELRAEVENQLKGQGLSDAPPKFIDELVLKIYNDLGAKRRTQRIKAFFKVIVLSCLALSFAGLMGSMSRMAESYVSREEVRGALTNVILKGANIDDVKLVYLSEVSGNPVDSIWPYLKPYLYYEKGSLTLLQVLNDLKVARLKGEQKLDDQDLGFIAQIDSLVLEHNKVNPFDGLDEQSLRDFRNISLKLNGVEYDKVKDELLNLNSAIKEKNRLIGQYLSSSNWSLYVSIFGVIFSVGVVVVGQIFSMRKPSQKQLIIDALNERMANNK